jgi:hypothetical protein
VAAIMMGRVGCEPLYGTVSKGKDIPAAEVLGCRASMTQTQDEPLSVIGCAPQTPTLLSLEMTMDAQGDSTSLTLNEWIGKIWGRSKMEVCASIRHD